MNGGILGKKKGAFKRRPFKERRGMKTCSSLFPSNLSKEQTEAGGEASMIFLLQVIHKFFIYLAFI
jgi:hypothetical protein